MLKLRKLTPPIKMCFLKSPPLFWKIWHRVINWFTTFYLFSSPCKERAIFFFSWIVRQRLYEGMLILIAFLQLLFKILKLKWLQFCQGLFPPTNYHYAIFISSSASNLFFLILKHRHWRKQKYLGKQKIATYHGSKYNYSQKN